MIGRNFVPCRSFHLRVRSREVERQSARILLSKEGEDVMISRLTLDTARQNADRMAGAFPTQTSHGKWFETGPNPPGGAPRQ